MKTVLVLTDGTEVGAHVTTRIHELHQEADDLAVYVLVPAAKVVYSIHGSEVPGTERAEVQLQEAMQLFENIGVRVDGEVGGHDPVQATRTVLSRMKPDLILVSTLPLGSSRWLNMDLPHRLRRRFGIPVEYVLGKAVNDSDWANFPEPIEGPIRILLVEDSAEEVRLMRHALAETEAQIALTVVGNGSEAVDLLRANGQDHIDLLLLDLKMPQVDGHQFLEIVGSEFDVDSLNITVVTSSADQGDRERAHALGAGAYIFKDPDIHVFAEAIQSVVEEVAQP